MKARVSAAALALLLWSGGRASFADGDATLFRLFLRDGTSLVSYGEFARVGERVIFSMPTAATPNPPLQLVNIPANRIDWDRTERYAERARAEHYFATQAEGDFAELSGVLSTALSDVVNLPDPGARLSVVENARKTLAEWSQTHYNYRHKDVQQMLSMLDEAIADLRTASGGERFDLTFVAVAASPDVTEPLMPRPTPRETIELTIAAARLTAAASERQALLDAALTALERDQARLPARWVGATRASISMAIDQEARVDRAYQSMAQRLVTLSERRARVADVRGVLRVVDLIKANDAALGLARPEIVDNALATVQTNLDAARELRLNRDAWVLRVQALREYEMAISTPLRILQSLDEPLKDIKELAGSSQAALTMMHRQVRSVTLLLATVAPPEQCRSAHSMLASAAQLADNAAEIRREAALSGNVTRAWDASAAAAGALMLVSRAKAEIQALLRPPALP